jgi:hypothetical protein
VAGSPDEDKESPMDAAKLPEMEDTALAVLHENAERLERTGTKSQQAAATALKPAIEAELATRREAKLARAKEAAAAKRAIKAAAAPKKAPKRKAS